MAGSKPAALPLGDTPAVNRSAVQSSVPQTSAMQPQHRMQRRAIQSARNKTVPAIWHPRRNALGLLRALEGGEDTRAGTRHARHDRRAVQVELRTQPAKRLGHLGAARAYYRFEHVDGAAFGKGAYCDDGGISCQFRGLEEFCGTH